MKMTLRNRPRGLKPLKFVGEWIVADVYPTGNLPSRLGIKVTKKYGNSPQRNRFKRLVREAFRLSYPSFKTGFDMLLRPRSKAAKAKMLDIKIELYSFVSRIS